MNWDKVIFLAHASEDKPFVKKLYKRLQKEGLMPWLDEKNLEPGVNWDSEIKDTIKKARFFLACFSAQSVAKSGYIQREFRMALNEFEQKAPKTIYFIPVLLENIELPDISVGTINLRDYQAVRVYEKDGLERLILQLKRQIGIPEELNVQEKTPIIHGTSYNEIYANWTSEEKFKFINALIECQTLKQPESRASLINDLDPEIKNQIPHDSTTRFHVKNIVETSARFPGGLLSFLKILGMYEGNSLTFKNIKALLQPKL